MRNALFLPVLLSCSLLAACQNGQPSAPAASEESAAPRATTDRPGALSSACQIVPEQDIRLMFNIDADTALQIEEGGGAFPSCSYQWGKDLVTRILHVGGQEIEVHEPAKLMIVVAHGVSADGFEQSTSVYKDAEDLPGPGERARWGAAMSQLSFLSGDKLFHLNVKTSSSPEQNRVMSVHLAHEVLRRI